MSYAQDMLDKLKSNKEKGGNKMILEQTEGTFVGSAIGLFLGLYIGHSRNYSLVVSGLVGMLLGGFVTKQMIKMKEK